MASCSKACPTRSRIIAPLASAIVVATSAPALAGIHTWDVKEVFSNASGTIQFIELIDNGTAGFETGVGNGTLTSGTQSHSFGNGAVATPTNGRSYLIATPAFAALPGVPTPDEVLPTTDVPFFNPAGDTIAFAGVDSWTFGPVPTNGTQSLERTGVVVNTITNTPKNYAGTQGSVNLNPAAVPSASARMIGVLALALSGVGAVLLRRR